MLIPDVIKYTADYQSEWDSFVDISRNGNFLFKRRYMEYHSDRFNDHSLLFFLDGKLSAILPANQDKTTLYSHRGLTYGGFIIDDRMKLPKFLSIFSAFLDYSRSHGIEEIYYKTIPHIYPLLPANEDLYALYLVGAEVVSRSMLTVVTPDNPIKWQSQRKRGARKALKNGVVTRQSDDFSAYWDLLSDLLDERFDAEPVHTLEEIRYLHDHFPEHIKLYAAYYEDEMVSGVLVYEYQQVARSQYIAANNTGKSIGALDLLFQFLLTDVYRHKPYFEFGSSDLKNTPNHLNIGLINQKEGFGARAIAHDTYRIIPADANTSQLHTVLS